jgi:hypothetical protein
MSVMIFCANLDAKNISSIDTGKNGVCFGWVSKPNGLDCGSISSLQSLHLRADITGNWVFCYWLPFRILGAESLRLWRGPLKRRRHRPLHL